MKKLSSALFIAVFFLALFSPGIARAEGDIEWSVKKQLKLESAPLDVATSIDGKWMFVLSKGEVLVYAAPEEKLLKKIPVDKTYDRISYSAANNTLIVSSSTEKSMKIIEIEVVQHFSLEGLPFKGPENAPVTLVVFSDYQ